MTKKLSKFQAEPELVVKIRSSHPEVFLGRDVLKICSKFTGEHPYRSVISVSRNTIYTKN